MAIAKGIAMLKTMQKHGVTLAIFAAALTGLTALVNELTKSTIEQQAARQQKALFDL
jgi:electron transport complex protein RnfG